MGHYSDAYEHDAQEATKRQKQELQAILKDVKKLRRSNHLPTRFLEMLEDCENWLIVKIQESN
jgi:mRNA-degrading endonuclease YafQ of YafQ-DinJ toxin-antitoxin module